MFDRIEDGVNELRLKLAECYDAQLAPISAAILPLHVDVNISLWRPDSLLANTQIYPKIFWKSRGAEAYFLAIGCARQWLDQDAFHPLSQSVESRDDVRHYWLSFFDSVAALSSLPETRPSARLTVPLLEVTAHSASIRLQLNVCTANPQCDYETLLDLLIAEPPDSIEESYLPTVRRKDLPTLLQWQKMVAESHRQFNVSALKKVVLARKTTLSAKHSVPFWRLFGTWQRQSENCFCYAYQENAVTGFMSFSPERLYVRDGKNLCTEALAGTNRRGTTAARDRETELSLLSDSKNIYEHRLVIEDLQHKLLSISDKICGEQTSLNKQRHIQHLYYPLRAQLKDNVTDADIIRTLHPTAAIAGLPQETACSLISSLEPGERGLFAGLFGVTQGDKSELAVGIRSALVTGKDVCLFAGAGIVPESSAAKEWSELDDKIAVPLSLFDIEEQPLPASASMQSTDNTMGKVGDQRVTNCP